MSIRNIEDIGLDEITEDFLREQRDDLADEYGVDSRQGSIYYDATEGHIQRTAKFFDDLRHIKEIISLDSCTGDVEDEWLRLKGMKRNPSEESPAAYEVIFDGETPEIGSEMSCDGHMFTLQRLDDTLVIVSIETGTGMNTLSRGLPVIPAIDVDGLISATLGDLVTAAVDVEEDDTARDRMLTALAGPSENANRTQLEAWCEEVPGVGRARIVPLWDGDNTAEGIIIGTGGTIPSETVVGDVQDYVDPGAEGLGEGKATIGLKFTAVAAAPAEMTIEAGVILETGFSLDSVVPIIREGIRAYFEELSLDRNSDTAVVRKNRIGNIISSTEGIVDYSDLQLNDDAVTVTCDITEIPVLTTLTITLAEE